MLQSASTLGQTEEMIRKTRAATASVSGNLRRDRRRSDLGNEFAVEFNSQGGKRMSQTKGRQTPAALESGGNHASLRQGISSAGLKPSSDQRQLHPAVRTTGRCMLVVGPATSTLSSSLTAAWLEQSWVKQYCRGPLSRLHENCG